MKTWLRRSAVVLAVGFFACAANADGEPCETSDDCESGYCSLAGKCGRGECACDGDECGRVQSTCPPNAVCWRSPDPLQHDYRVCRQLCDVDRKCPAGQQCDDGTCAPGPEPLALIWESAPQSCTLGSPCTFRVRPPEDSAMDNYSWTLGEHGQEPTTEVTNAPELVHTFRKAGTYELNLVAKARDGATGQLKATTTVCVGAGGSCASGALCCSGTCGADGDCR